MTLSNYIFVFLFYLLITTWGQFIGREDASNSMPKSYGDEKVEVKLFYECFCPHCVNFDKKEFTPVVQKLNNYLNLHTYPYGNAKTYEKDGHIVFECQHGPHECYGNMLHACAIDIIKNLTAAIIFNECMMEFPANGSDDRAADRCAASMSLNSDPIKACAKGERGTELLKYYGEESKKANFAHVPRIIVNGKVKGRTDFMKEVCVEFTVPPPPCAEYL